MVKITPNISILQPRPIIFLSLVCMLFLSISKTASAQRFPNPVEENLSVSAGAGIHNENFRWSIAGNTDGKNPNILSEIIFDPIRSAGFYINAEYNLYKRVSVQGSFSQLYTYKGSVTDFDYNGDNRTDPETELYLNSDKGNRRTAGGTIYYHLLNSHNFIIKAGAGYNTTKELLYLLNDHDPDLQSTYTARWKGPEISTKVRWNSKWKVYLDAGICFDFLKYNAEANWNAIAEFQHPVSFIQTANGNGWHYNIAAGYQFNKNISISAGWLYTDWKTRYGTDRLFLTDGTIPETRMNGAFKKNSGWRLGATYTF